MDSHIVTDVLDFLFDDCCKPGRGDKVGWALHQRAGQVLPFGIRQASLPLHDSLAKQEHRRGGVRDLGRIEEQEKLSTYCSEESKKHRASHSQIEKNQERDPGDQKHRQHNQIPQEGKWANNIASRQYRGFRKGTGMAEMCERK